MIPHFLLDGVGEVFVRYKLGRGTKNLPLKMEETFVGATEHITHQFAWILNEKGYPVEFYNDNDIFTIYWQNKLQ